MSERGRLARNFFDALPREGARRPRSDVPRPRTWLCRTRTKCSLCSPVIRRAYWDVFAFGTYGARVSCMRDAAAIFPRPVIGPDTRATLACDQCVYGGSRW